MTDPIPLPIWPPDADEARLALIREAKLGLQTDIRIIPCPAVPGSPGRILAFGEVPPFVCESVLIRPEDVDNVEVVRGRLDYLLHAPTGTPGSFTDEMWLSAVMGVGVKLTHEEAHPNPEDSKDDPLIWRWA